MVKKGFTLLELLIVIGIMSMLGTISVNGYRAVVRGMEERSAMSSVSAFLRSARQRAEIDHKPVCIFYWNEMIQAGTDDEMPLIVGKAVAVQQVGRVTGTYSNEIYDEFSDLNLGYELAEGDAKSSRGTIRIYNLSSSNGEYAIVASQVKEEIVEDNAEDYFKSSASDREYQGANEGIVTYAFKKESGSDFKAGDAYGFEFARISLPKGYLLGSNTLPTSMSSPIAGKGSQRIDPSSIAKKPIAIYSLRPKKGEWSAEKVGEATDESNKKK